MKHLRLFETEADYNAATLDLPVVSYVKKTGNVYYNGKHAVDRVLNAPLMNMCVANGWAKESNDYLTYEEAAIIGTLNINDFSTYNVVSAWELKYFTGLSLLDRTNFTEPATTLETLYIPDNVVTLFNPTTTNNDFGFPNLKKLHIGDGQTAIRTNWSYLTYNRTTFNGSIVYLGKNVTSYSGGGYFPLIFESVIWNAEPLKLPSTGASLDKTNVYIADENVDTLKGLEPFVRVPSCVHPISEYIGDSDY